MHGYMNDGGWMRVLRPTPSSPMAGDSSLPSSRHVVAIRGMAEDVSGEPLTPANGLEDAMQDMWSSNPSYVRYGPGHGRPTNLSEGGRRLAALHHSSSKH